MSAPLLWRSLVLMALLQSMVLGQAVESPAVPELGTYIESARQAWGVPGLAVAIVQDDRVEFIQGFGTLEGAGSQPVDADTLFAIASNTKAFTAAALAMLVDEGKIRWDDHVRQYLPAFDLEDRYAAAEMTIRDLLCHRSGLGTYSGDLLWYGTSYSPEDVLRRARFLPPASSFRASYGYSNLMFLAAGEVVRVVSQEPWELVIRKRIFGPLGMTRTVTSVNDLVSMANVATPHKATREGPRAIEWMNWDNMAAAGGIISSAEDMSHWLRCLLRRGKLDQQGQVLLREESLLTMWSAHTPIPISQSAREQFPSTHFRAYGLGWELRDYQGVQMVAHGGGYDGMFSRVTLIPEKNLGIVVLTNGMTSIPSALSFSLVDRFLGRRPRDWSSEMLKTYQTERDDFYKRIDRAVQVVEGPVRPPRPWAEYIGTYTCPMYGGIEVTEVDHQLVLRFLPFPELVADLTHLHFDTFLLKWRHESAWFDEGTVQFVPDARGRFIRLRFDVPNDDLWFHELKFQRAAVER